MKFSSRKQLEKYLKQSAKAATQKIRDGVEGKFIYDVNSFYADYTPVSYMREYKLFDAVNVSDINATPYGYNAVVYFDPNMMQHDSMYLYYNPVTKEIAMGQRTMSDAEILEMVLVGDLPHGMYDTGMDFNIWNDKLKQWFVDPNGGLKDFIYMCLTESGLNCKRR